MNIILVFVGSGVTLALGLWVGLMIESHPGPTIVVAAVGAVLVGMAVILARKISRFAKLPRDRMTAAAADAGFPRGVPATDKNGPSP